MIVLNIQDPLDIGGQVTHGNAGLGILPDIANGFVKKLKGQSNMRLIDLVHPGDNRGVRDAVSRTGDDDCRNPAFHYRFDFIGELAFVHHFSSGGKSR